jgi:aminomethyltransferase
MAQPTPLSDRHRALGARMTDFHGYAMPLWYRGLVEEHRMVRESAGLFDLCHMARIDVRGAGAIALLDGLVTRSVPAIPLGAARYALLTNAAGGRPE